MRYYTAVVHDSADPDKRGRLQLTIPALLDDVWPDWIDVWSPMGLASVWVPRKDDLVVVCRGEGGALRWLGGPVEGQASRPDVFRSDYGNRHGIASADGKTAVVVKNTSGVLVIAGPGGAITLATAENAAVEPLLLGDKTAAAWDALTSLLKTFFTGLSVATVTGNGSTALTAVNALPSGASFKSKVSSTE